MSDSPLERPIEMASETAQNAVQRVRSSVSILSGQEPCDDCGAAMEATQCYSPNLAAFSDDGTVPCYECPECGRQEHREPDEIGVSPFR